MSRAASPAASRARVRAKVLRATTCVAIAGLTLAACFDRTTAPSPSLAPVPRHDFLGDADWGANNSAASGSYDGTIDPVYGGAPPAAQPLGPIVYPTFITANVSGQVQQVPGALQGSNIVREAWSTNDPYYWGSMGFRSNGSVWYPVGPSAVLRVVAPIAPFRNDAGGQPTGDWSHCGWAGYALCWTWAGSAHFDFQRIHVDLTLARSPDTTVWQGTAATFTAGMSQTTFPGNPYPVDMSALQWRWISDSTASDSVGCQSTSGKTCTHVFMTPGTMYSAAYVNGEAQQKSMHVDVRIPKLELSASTTTLLVPGDSDTFVATGDLPMVIEGWNFAPDTVGGSSPDATVGSTWGACVANVSMCTNYVSRPGTVSVIGTVHGVRRTARLHVNVVPPPPHHDFTLDVDHPSVVAGDTATFTPKSDGVSAQSDRWRWVSDSAATGDNTECIAGATTCRKRMIVGGTMWAYSGQDSASAHVSVSAPSLTLSVTPNATGDSATFQISTNGPLSNAQWTYTPNGGAATSPPGCASSSAQCTAPIGTSGTMGAGGTVGGTSVSDSVMISVTMPEGCAAELSQSSTSSARMIRIPTRASADVIVDDCSAPDDPAAPAYVAPDWYKKPSTFKLDFTDQLNISHYFYLEGARFQRTKVLKTTKMGVYALYKLIDWESVSSPEGATLLYVNVLTVLSTLTEISLGNYVGGFIQNGRAGGMWRY